MKRTRGAAGTTEAWSIPKELWILRPARESDKQKESVEILRAAAAQLPDVNLEEVRSSTHVGRQGRHREIVSPGDFRKLYVRSHRAHLWVAAVAGMSVRLDPSRAIEPKNLSTVETATRYKVAGYSVISRLEEARRFIDRLDGDPVPSVTSHLDPRCLPLHSFSPGCPHDLDSDEGQVSFIRDHRRKSQKGSGACLVDLASREWKVDPSMHGADSLHVRGLHLPTGFHWDVQTARKRTSFANGWERWETVNSSHLNVHPDGFVRAPHAELVWSWATAEQKTRKRKPR